MIRSIALVAILGALVAAGVLYSASEPDWRQAIAIWLGTSEPAPAAKLATETPWDQWDRKPTGHS